MKVNIEINGLGAELILLPLTPAAFDYWDQSGDDALLRYVSDLDPSPSYVPDEANFRSDGADCWDLPNLGHFFGFSPDATRIDIDVSDDARSQRVLSEDFRKGLYRSGMTMHVSSFRDSALSKDARILEIERVVKGTWHYQVELEQKSDFRAMQFQALSFFNETLITGLSFNGELQEQGDCGGREKGLFTYLYRTW